MNKFKLVDVYNKQAHDEIKIMGSPRYVDPEAEGRRFYLSRWTYDSDEVWGIPNDELEEWVASIKKRWHKAISPRERSKWKREFYKWRCREAAAMGLSIVWT